MTEDAIRSLIHSTGVAQFVGIQHCASEIGDDLVLLRHRDLPGSTIGIRKCELSELAVLLAVSAQMSRFNFRRPDAPARIVRVSRLGAPLRDGSYFIGNIDVPEVIHTKEKPTDLSAKEGRLMDADAIAGTAADATTASLIQEFSRRTGEVVQGQPPLPQNEEHNATV